jgi:tRNA(fMet)-specific endonuclease VapC
MILDSTFLIDVLRGDESVSSIIENVDSSGTAFVSSITVMELSEGIHLSDATERERDAVHELLTDLTELSFDRDCALQAGEINGALVSSGEPIDTADVMIAATAIVHDQAVVTRNVDHFERIDDVDVLSY